MSLLPLWTIPQTDARHALARHALARHTWDVPDGPGRQSPSAPRACASVLPHPSEARFMVERLGAVEAMAHRDAWVGLVARALEPNVFLDPDFALPAAQHLGGAARPCFLLVWAVEPAGGRDLVAVCPIVGRSDPLRALATAWFHDLASLGFPLLDRAHGADALGALLLWSAEGLHGVRGLVIRSLPAEGPTAVLLREMSGTMKLDLLTLAVWERAVLRRDAPASGNGLSAKGTKELRRQGRRLAGRGAVGYTSARSDHALRAAVELFLALEAGGWKGAAGTALLMRPGLTAFARASTRLLGRRGLCRVDSLTLDGVPVAMGIVLTAGATDYLWKIAYREDLARLSPGVQFTLAFTEAQRREGRAAVTDSCAVPRHPMIDRLWRDRLALCDVAVATRPGRSHRFRLAVAAARGARQARAAAKRAVAAWRARRASAGPPSP